MYLKHNQEWFIIAYHEEIILLFASQIEGKDQKRCAN